MSRRLDAKRARQLGGPEPRTPPPNDLLTTEGGIAVSSGVHHGKEDEGLEGLGVTVNSPVSESVHRQRPSAMDRRAQIAKCKSLRNVIRDFENTFTTEHGHQPRGPERTPLRNVYLQYRRLKQGVRGMHLTRATRECENCYGFSPCYCVTVRRERGYAHSDGVPRPPRSQAPREDLRLPDLKISRQHRHSYFNRLL
jgi:hypothetical protein